MPVSKCGLVPIRKNSWTTTSAAPPDLRLAANGIDFMRMMMREEDPDTLFFNRKLQIEGDTELGLITKNLLDSVEWPFSEWFLKRSTSTLD